jgi:hypothetical protein
MRITVQYGEKVPGDEEFSSKQHSVAIDLEPPPEVAQDKEKLRAYVESMTAEVKARVQSALRKAAEPPRRATERAPSRATPNGRASVRPAPRPTSNGNGRERANGEAASMKQVNFIRSLASKAGYNATQLEYLAEEVIGSRKPIGSLTKAEASSLIETLRGGE